MKNTLVSLTSRKGIHTHTHFRNIYIYVFKGSDSSLLSKIKVWLQNDMKYLVIVNTEVAYLKTYTCVNINSIITSIKAHPSLTLLRYKLNIYLLSGIISRSLYIEFRCGFKVFLGISQGLSFPSVFLTIPIFLLLTWNCHS